MGGSRAAGTHLNTHDATTAVHGMPAGTRQRGFSSSHSTHMPGSNGLGGQQQPLPACRPPAPLVHGGTSTPSSSPRHRQHPSVAGVCCSGRKRPHAVLLGARRSATYGAGPGMRRRGPGSGRRALAESTCPSPTHPQARVVGCCGRVVVVGLVSGRSLDTQQAIGVSGRVGTHTACARARFVAPRSHSTGGMPSDAHGPALCMENAASKQANEQKNAASKQASKQMSIPCKCMFQIQLVPSGCCGGACLVVVPTELTCDQRTTCDCPALLMTTRTTADA